MMRKLATGALILACAAILGCVDPAHSRFASKGPCEVSVGSHFCTGGDPDEGSAMTNNPDPALRQFPGTFSGGGGR